MVSLEQIIRYKYLPYFPTEVEHFIYEEIIENSSLLYGPQTDFKKIWQDKLSALADKAWNDYHTQVTE